MKTNRLLSGLSVASFRDFCRLRFPTPTAPSALEREIKSAGELWLDFFSAHRGPPWEPRTTEEQSTSGEQEGTAEELGVLDQNLRGCVSRPNSVTRHFGKLTPVQTRTGAGDTLRSPDFPPKIMVVLSVCYYVFTQPLPFACTHTQGSVASVTCALRDHPTIVQNRNPGHSLAVC